jgi:hypothetical protein
MFRPTAYAFIYGHVGRNAGKNVVDATRVRKVTNPHEAFQHMLDIFIQHLFFIRQAQSVVGKTHKMDEGENVESRSSQKRQMD